MGPQRDASSPEPPAAPAAAAAVAVAAAAAAVRVGLRTVLELRIYFADQFACLLAGFMECTFWVDTRWPVFDQVTNKPKRPTAFSLHFTGFLFP